MAYVQVPKDLTKVKTKFILNLTKRQALCFTAAALIGVPFYICTKGALGSTLSASLMVVLMLPFFVLAMYEKDGKPLEKVLKNVIEARYIRPVTRPYKTKNFYAALQREIYEREVLGIDQRDTEKAGLKGRLKKWE